MTVAERTAAIERIAQAWCASPEQFDRAVRETVAATGLIASVVEQQLREVVSGITARLLVDVLDRELGDHCLLDEWVATADGERRALAPRRTIHLAAASVPGLSIESCLWGLALGGVHLVRPAHDDEAFAPFLEIAQHTEPELASRIELVDEVDWRTIDAAVIHGSSDTIEFVRSHLGQTAPIAAFGSREGLAVVTERGMRDQPDWAERVAQDIVRFDTAGCMTPRRLVVVGTMECTLSAQQLLDAAIEQRQERSFARRTSMRRDADQRLLAAIAARMGHNVSEHQTPPPHPMIDVLAVASIAELVDALFPPWKLQTACLVCATDEADALCDALASSGCTRLCRTGDAHNPLPGWRHDGRGRVIDLVRFVERESALVQWP